MPNNDIGDFIWVDPKPNGAFGNCWHNACKEPRHGFLLYVRLGSLDERELINAAIKKIRAENSNPSQ